MHYRIYKFFNDNNLVYLLQFGFRQTFPAVPVLIKLDPVLIPVLIKTSISFTG